MTDPEPDDLLFATVPPRDRGANGWSRGGPARLRRRAGTLRRLGGAATMLLARAMALLGRRDMREASGQEAP